MQPLLIQTRQASADRMANLLLTLVVLLALGVAWTGQGATIPSLLALLALLILSSKLPGLLGASRRAGACRTGSLCAQTKLSYHRPAWLRIDETGDVQVCWPENPGVSVQEPGPHWLPAQSFQSLHLGQLVQITVVTRHPDIDLPSTDVTGRALDSAETSLFESLTQQGSCLLWLPRLPADQAAALRRWLLWQKRGGRAGPAV